MGYVGFLLMMAAGMGMGLYGAHRLRRQAQYIRQVCRLLQTLDQQMSFTALPIGPLWQQLAAQTAFSDYRLLQDTAVGLGTTSFDIAFASAVEQAQTDGVLTPSGRQLLLEFGAGCGRYDLTRQAEHIRHYRRRLEELESTLDQQATVKGRLYRVLGLAGGMALALLLL